MIYGISKSKDILLSSIAGALDEKTKKAYVIDRLSDNLSNDLSSSIDKNYYKLEIKEIKTKTMVKALTDLKVEGKTLIVLPENNKNVYMSARNIEGVKAITANNINVFDLLKYTNLILPVDTVKKLEEVYA